MFSRIHQGDFLGVKIVYMRILQISCLISCIILYIISLSEHWLFVNFKDIIYTVKLIDMKVSTILLVTLFL